MGSSKIRPFYILSEEQLQNLVNGKKDIVELQDQRIDLEKKANNNVNNDNNSDNNINNIINNINNDINNVEVIDLSKQNNHQGIYKI